MAATPKRTKTVQLEEARTRGRTGLMCSCKMLLGRKPKLHSTMSTCTVSTARVAVQVTECFNLKRFHYGNFQILVVDFQP